MGLADSNLKGVLIKGGYVKLKLVEIKNTKAQREQGNIKELADNIQKEGLLQPLVVNQNNELICGRRRYEAIKLLNWSEVEVYQIKTIDDIDKLSKAIAENVMRKQLTWQEEVNATAELEQLRVAKYGKAIRGRRTDIEPCPPDGRSSIRTIARETKRSKSVVAENLQLDRALKQYPELNKERTKSRALRKLKQIKRQKEKKIILTDIKPILKCGDFRKLIKEIPDNSINLILTDPPYSKNYLSLWNDLAKEGVRILKPSGFFIVYSGQVCLPEKVNMLSKYLSYYWLGMLYHKGSIAQRFEVNMFNRAKPILFFYKPPLKKQENWLEDVLVSEQQDKDLHEWGQNVEPFKKLIECFSKEGDTILDPFLGGGAVVEAGILAKRNITGFEIDKNSFDTVYKRIYGKKGNN